VSDFSFFDWKKNEIIFVVSVVVVLMGISYFQLLTGQMKARDAQRKADVELVGRALDQYLSDHKVLPLASDGKIVICGGLRNVPCEWGNGQITDIEGVDYLKKIPMDPKSYAGRRYMYERLGENKYRISVALEYVRDVAWKNNLTTVCGKEIQCNWYVQN